MRYTIAPTPLGAEDALDIVDNREADPHKAIVARLWLPLYVVQAMLRVLNAHAEIARQLHKPFPAATPSRHPSTSTTSSSH